MTPDIFNLILFALWALPIPKITEMHIKGLVAFDTQQQLSDTEIKGIALFCGVLWPIFFISRMLRGR